MSNVESSLDALRRAYASLSDLNAVMAQHPGDIFVKMNRDSVAAHAKKLEDEWLESCRLSQVEVCRYRLVSARDFYSANAFSKSLLTFQELFSQIFDALKNGAKDRARLGAESAAETEFCLAYTFPGSLGVVLTVKDEPNLIEGKFDRAVEAFHDVIGMDDEHDVRDTARALGNAVVKKVYDWAEANYQNDLSVDVLWTSGAKGRKAGGYIDSSAFARYIDIINRTSDVEKTEVVVRGVLVAIDLKSDKFRIVDPAGTDYAGKFSESFDARRQWSVNKVYSAEIGVEKRVHYATQKTDVTYLLKSLTDAQTS